MLTQQTPELTAKLYEMPTWDHCLDMTCLGRDLDKLFEQEILLPGVILTRNHQYQGMISRESFFKRMSRSYSQDISTPLWPECRFRPPAMNHSSSSNASEAVCRVLGRTLAPTGWLWNDPLQLLALPSSLPGSGSSGDNDNTPAHSARWSLAESDTTWTGIEKPFRMRWEKNEPPYPIIFATEPCLLTQRIKVWYSQQFNKWL